MSTTHWFKFDTGTSPTTNLQMSQFTYPIFREGYQHICVSPGSRGGLGHAPAAWVGSSKLERHPWKTFLSRQTLFYHSFWFSENIILGTSFGGNETKPAIACRLLQPTTQAIMYMYIPGTWLHTGAKRETPSCRTPHTKGQAWLQPQHFISHSSSQVETLVSLNQLPSLETKTLNEHKCFQN